MKFRRGVVDREDINPQYLMADLKLKDSLYLIMLKICLIGIIMR